MFEMKKVRSLLTQSAPASDETLKLQETVKGALSLSFAQEQDAPVGVRDLVSYFFGLLVLVNAWAFCGNFMAEGGKECKFISLPQCKDYADGA